MLTQPLRTLLKPFNQANMKIFKLLLLCLGISFCQAQTQFIRTYGGTADRDLFQHAIQSLDGGYIFVGLNSSFSTAGDVSGFIMKTDEAGNVIWASSYGSSTKYDYLVGVWQAPDSSIYALGIQSQASRKEYFVLAKFSRSGQLLWDKMVGGMESGYDEQAEKIIGYDNHLYLIGSSRNNGSLGESNLYVVKMDMAGNKIWAKAYGENGEDQIRNAVVSSNGALAGGGITNSIGGGDWDFMMTEIDTAGNLQWMKSYGTSAKEWAEGMLELSDGTRMVAGYREANGHRDILLIRTSATGTLLWAKTFGGSGNDICFAIHELPSGYIACAGASNSFGSGDEDALLLVIDKQGQPIKAVTYGGSADDAFYNATVLQDGTVLMTGETNSPGYTQGLEDFLAIKVSASPGVDKICPNQSVINLIQDSVITSLMQVDSAGQTVSSYLEHTANHENLIASPAGEAICLRVTSIEAEKLSAFSIAPNPASNVLVISPETPVNQQLSYSLVDITGKCLSKGNIPFGRNSFQLNINHLSKGLYLLMIQNDEKVIWKQKWIKE